MRPACEVLPFDNEDIRTADVKNERKNEKNSKKLLTNLGKRCIITTTK